MNNKKNDNSIWKEERRLRKGYINMAYIKLDTLVHKLKETHEIHQILFLTRYQPSLKWVDLSAKAV